MNFRDDTKPPLSTERSDLYWGTHLTYSELLAEDLDDRPSRLLLLLAEATGRRVPSDAGAPGVDTEATVAPTHRTARGGNPVTAPAPTSSKGDS